jgi:phytanoyl-CoA hydroxylase
MQATATMHVEPSCVEEYSKQGYTVVRGLFTEQECDRYSDYFTEMVESGGGGFAETRVDPAAPDPLHRYPRLLQPHRKDDVAFNFMINPRVRDYLTALVGAEPYAVQTMVYFKPPGARGQNLHQDNMFLLVQPGTCIAAWLALDDCDDENGCMVLAPGTQDFPVICQVTREGLDEEQWNNTETPLPPGVEPQPCHMKRGDVLFFNGSVIHGSYKNRSKDRFRRTMIGHYIAAEAKQVAKYYFPVFRMDGSVVSEGIDESLPSGPCGVYEDQEVVLSGRFKTWEAAH